MSEIIPLGDSAVSIVVGDGITAELSDIVIDRAAAISGERIAGVSDVVASYGSIAVHYDPTLIQYRDLHGRLVKVLEREIASASNPRAGRLHEIPVRYDGEDMSFVSETTGLAAEEIVRLHSAQTYRVFVIGFVPGFAYLGPLDSRLVIPRRASPRKRVPPGSVAIAEAQTAVYPSATPGGWHLIGTTSVGMFDPQRGNPSLLAVGDRVRFVPQ